MLHRGSLRFQRLSGGSSRFSQSSVQRLSTQAKRSWGMCYVRSKSGTQAGHHSSMPHPERIPLPTAFPITHGSARSPCPSTPAPSACIPSCALRAAQPSAARDAGGSRINPAVSLYQPVKKGSERTTSAAWRECCLAGAMARVLAQEREHVWRARYLH